MPFDHLLTERLKLFELTDLNESELEILCHRQATLESCKYYTSNCIAKQNSSFKSIGNFTILHHNVRSLRKNGDEFKDLVCSLNIPISCALVTETWLKDTTASPVLNGFTLWQQNRDCRCGGGVGIFVNSSLNCFVREDLKLDSNILESLFLEISNNNARNILIGCIYRPPEGSILQCIEQFEIMFGKLQNENKIIYIGGDFNINLLHYSVDGLVSQFIELFLSQNLYPTVDRPTRVSNTTNTLIDCFFTNFLGPATSGVIVDTMVSDHFPIILTSSLGLLPNKVPKVSNRRFAPDKIEAFNTRLLSLFENFNQIECANTAVNFFCETIESEIDNFSPCP